ncbi:Inositol-1,4,5-trisphosphate 5-phosphatase [Quillaja saponaria]|uniref:Inositol-1,4,5-trisphosphate 5-phosphatase n=1 Tax=Quillaja saponaria TaxID=32244 RepID=A0AAD7KPF0_QUISA|nr:Inositol-1,4,5-trisphosphate 5-phosphatase [Quillaja saponaria]
MAALIPAAIEDEAVEKEIRSIATEVGITIEEPCGRWCYPSNDICCTQLDLYVFATPYRITWDYHFSAREHTLKFDSWEEPADEAAWVFSVCLKDERGNLWVGESGHENEKGEEITVVIPWEEWWKLTFKDSSNPHIALLPLHPELHTKFISSTAWAYARSMSGIPYGYHNMIFSWIDTITDNCPPPLDARYVISIMSMWTIVQPAYAANMWNEALNKWLGTDLCDILRCLRAPRGQILLNCAASLLDNGISHFIYLFLYSSQGLDLHDILVEAEKRKIAFDQLLTIPEQDEWEYSDGKTTTCVAFILSMYKEAGIFGPVSSSIQVMEFTIHNACMLNIF